MDIPVIIDKIIFKSEKGFAILAASLNAMSSKYTPDLEDVVAKNTDKNNYNNFPITVGMLDVQEQKMEGGQFIFIGDFVKHPKYGKQFKATFYYREQPSTEDGLRAYLQSLPNIKDVRSREIVKKWGVAETVRILNEEPMKLTEINGITEQRVPPIKEKWDKEKNLRELYIWLNNHGVSPELAKKIYATWKEHSLETLTLNPYKLAEIKGIGFITADMVAHKVFEEVPRDFRTTACMKYVLEEEMRKNSNLCMPYSTFKTVVLKTLQEGNEKNNPKESIKNYVPLIPECVKKNLDTFTAIKNATETGNGAYIYLREIWNKEKFIAEQIYRRRTIEEHEHEKEQKENDASPITQQEDNAFAFVDKDIEEAQKDVSEFSKREIILDDTQKLAIRSAFEHNITVITGGGGTGKSTICRCIFHLAEEKDLSIRFMSPTGKASQVLAAKTGYPAQTIHMSLKMMPGEDFAKEPIKEDITVIDEVSMVGIDTMFAVMSALEENEWGHIVFVGDPNQLPSVSPGNFLSDIIKSGCVNVVKLDKIHRQSEQSYIPLLANEVSKGKIVEIPEEADDIKWHHLTNVEPFEVVIRRVVKDFVAEESADNLQMIAPMYKGEHGINRVNEIIQQLMAEINEVKANPFTRGFQTFFVGDRVLQTENNYDKDIFNGDIGTIIEAGKKVINPAISDEPKDYVVVNFYGEHLTYIGDEIEELKLAWCCSVHKYQGSQSPYVIFILPREAQIMASKEILYTGITRAEKRVDIYGHYEIFRLAPTKSAVKKRHTNMNNIIKELKENKKILTVLE